MLNGFLQFFASHNSDTIALLQLALIYYFCTHFEWCIVHVSYLYSTCSLLYHHLYFKLRLAEWACWLDNLNYLSYAYQIFWQSEFSWHMFGDTCSRIMPYTNVLKAYLITRFTWRSAEQFKRHCTWDIWLWETVAQKVETHNLQHSHSTLITSYLKWLLLERLIFYCISWLLVVMSCSCKDKFV